MMPQVYVYIYKDENVNLSMNIKFIYICPFHEYMENKFKYMANASERSLLECPVSSDSAL